MPLLAHSGDKITTLVDATSDFDGKKIIKGSTGIVSEVTFDPERYIVEFYASGQSPLTGGIPLCKISFKREQIEKYKPTTRSL